jgi:hypothetical protein
MNRIYIPLAVVAAGGGGFAALMFSAVRSDFINRGCHEIPSIEWELTANCLDGNFGMRLTGAVGVLALLVFSWSVWRLRRG